MKSKLEQILELPFEEYIQACWQHAFDIAGKDPIAMYLYQMTIKEPSSIEAMWAKRYWYNKCNTKDYGENQ